MRYNTTVQGRTIVEELRKVCNHPTADQIFEMVRPRLPKISRGTVYRNLDKLARQGEILMLNTAGDQRRYDGNPMPHFHLRCDACGGVSDVSLPKMRTLTNYLTRLARKLEVRECNLEFVGACDQCKKSSESHHTQPQKRRKNP